MTEPFKLVYVEWEDSLGCSAGWSFMDETAAGSDIEPLLVLSVGFLYGESDSSLFLLPHIIEETEDRTMQGMGGVTIPKSAVRRMVNLDIPDSRVKRAAGRVLCNPATSKRAKARAGRGLTQKGSSQ